MKSLRKFGPESSSSRPNILLLKSFGQISISTNFNSGKFSYAGKGLELWIKAVGSWAVICYLLLWASSDTLFFICTYSSYCWVKINNSLF